MSTKKHNWAILGCGKIAAKFSSDLKLLPNARLYATASRDLEKARDFAEKYDFEKAYGSYEEMVSDPDVDIVYVATPHSFHHDHAILCLEHGKPVLVEKVFALDTGEAREMIDAARRNQVFLMEAFWTRFQPSFLRVLEVLQSGELGAPAMMRSEFCFHAPYDPETRLFSKALGGGSLLDIGIYPVFWALQLFGKPSVIQVTADMAPTGVDRSLAVTFNYQDNKIAQLASSFNACSDTQTEVWCEKGFIRQRKVDQSTVKVTINRKGLSEEEEIFHFDHQGFGLFLEAKHVMECLDAGLTESPVLPHSYTLEQMEVLDEIRQKAKESRV